MAKDCDRLNDEKIQSILANARASLNIEGLEVTENETEVVRKYLSGTHTEKEVLEIIRNG